jgi:hypothetical protein
MMDQRRIANEVALQAQQQQAAAQQQVTANVENNAPVTTQAYSEPESAPVATQPAPSTLYVIPSPTPAYPYYSYYSRPYYYPYPYSYYGYGGYYGYSRPVVGFRFGAGARSFHSFHSSFHHR